MPGSAPGTDERRDRSGGSAGAGKTDGTGAGTGAGTAGGRGAVGAAGCGAAKAAATLSIVARPSPAVARTVRRPNLLLVRVMYITFVRYARVCIPRPGPEARVRPNVTSEGLFLV